MIAEQHGEHILHRALQQPYKDVRMQGCTPLRLDGAERSGDQAESASGTGQSVSVLFGYVARGKKLCVYVSKGINWLAARTL